MSFGIPRPSWSITPMRYIPITLPASADLEYHSKALPQSCSTPSTSEYMKPRLNIALAYPSSADLSYNSMAFSRSSLRPAPWALM